MGNWSDGFPSDLNKQTAAYKQTCELPFAYFNPTANCNGKTRYCMKILYLVFGLEKNYYI